MSTAIRRALYGRMAGDTTLTGMLGEPPAPRSQSIYHRQAPQSATYPYVVFNKQSGVPTDTFQQAGAFEDEIWLVKGIDKSESTDVVEAIQARLIVLLNDAPLSISGRSLMWLRRQTDNGTEFDEVVDGQTFQHAGSLFRLVHQPQ